MEVDSKNGFRSDPRERRGTDSVLGQISQMPNAALQQFFTN